MEIYLKPKKKHLSLKFDLIIIKNLQIQLKIQIKNFKISIYNISKLKNIYFKNYKNLMFIVP